MLEPQLLLPYLFNAAKLCSMPAMSQNTHERMWSAPFAEICSGILSSHLTREILLEYSMRHSECGFGERPVPVACCLRSLYNTEKNIRVPLLYVRCTLDADGSLTALPDKPIWIPSDVLAVNELYNQEIALCDLDTYHAHLLAMSSLPSDGSWDTVLERGLDLFASIDQLATTDLERLGFSYETDTCTLQLCELSAEYAVAARKLEHVFDLCSQEVPDESAVSLPLRTLLQEAVPQHDSNVLEELPEEQLLSHKLLCGVPDHLPYLASRDIDALMAFAQQKSGDVLAIRAPKGTQGFAVALAAMANLYTDCALRGDRAPTMMCACSPETIDQMALLISQRPTVGQTALTTRWLPRIANASAPGSTADKRILGPLAALCLYHTVDGVRAPQNASFLVQPSLHVGSGDMNLYGDEWYIPKAQTYYLDCVSGFLHMRIKTVTEARQILSEKLRHIDQDRCELIEAYNEVCKASELLKRRDAIVARIGKMRRTHTACRKRLEFWEGALKEHPARKSLFSNAEPDQSKLIEQLAQPKEEAAKDKKLITEVCTAYQDKIARLENSIDRLRSASANLTKRSRTADPDGKQCLQIIARLSEACNLSAEQTVTLTATLDGRAKEVAIPTLNEALNTTVRPAEFWLSLHIYESSWIELNQRRRNAGARPSDDSNAFIASWNTICPFQFVPVANMMSTIDALHANPDWRMSLLVLPEAEKIDMIRGFALAGNADQVLAVGSEGALRMAPPCLPTMDELYVKAEFEEEAWQQLTEAGMTLSSGMSLFDYVLTVPDVPCMKLHDTEAAYGEIDDARNDLFPEEPLRTNRQPASSEDDDLYTMRGIAPSISYVTVPDSSWEQIGYSRQNRAEALALSRWLKRHLADMTKRLTLSDGPSIAIVTPFATQTALVRSSIQGLASDDLKHIEVCNLNEVGSRTWPVVLMCCTCGPEAFGRFACQGVQHILNIAAAAATDTLILFCGSAWERCADSYTAPFLARAQ